MNRSVYIVAISLIILGMNMKLDWEPIFRKEMYDKLEKLKLQIIIDLINCTGVAMYILGWTLIAIVLATKYSVDTRSNVFLIHTTFWIIISSIIWLLIEYKYIIFLARYNLPLTSIVVLGLNLFSPICIKPKPTFKQQSLIVLSTFILIFGEYFLLPLQRESNMKDGIGSPFMILGWVLLFETFNDLKQPNSKCSKYQESEKFINMVE